jgi:hypothetical protein
MSPDRDAIGVDARTEWISVSEVEWVDSRE